VANATGTWHWVATYTGDANNNSVSSGPLDEPVIIPQQADLAITKTVDHPTPNVGDVVTFTLTLTNKGPDSATGGPVPDPLPAGLIFVSASASVGTYDPAAGVWTVGTLAAGASATLTITAAVAGSAPVTNIATAGGNEFDPDPGDNTDSST